MNIMEYIKYRPIGKIHSPFKEPKGTPIQPSAGKDVKGIVEVFSEYAEGLKDIDGFSHIILIIHLHLAIESKLVATPFMDDEPHGIFAIRGPSRPNPIGISIVRLDKVEGNILHILDLDIIDGTPLLDIKPYLPAFDEKEAVKIGWLENKHAHIAKFKR